MVAMGVQEADSGATVQGRSWGIYTRIRVRVAQRFRPATPGGGGGGGKDNCRGHLAATGTPWGRLDGTDGVANKKWSLARRRASGVAATARLERAKDGQPEAPLDEP